MIGLSLRGIIKMWPLAAALAAVVTATASLPADQAYASSIARSFKAKGVIEPGKVVALVLSDNTATVELAPAAEPGRVYGVVIEQKAAPITIQQSDQEVFVATSGVFPVFVNLENGAIKAGDYISMSSTDGVATKAGRQHNFILGRATQDYSGSAAGKVNIEIEPGKNPNLGGSLAVPESLRRLFETVAGRPLSTLRIYSALAIFLVTSAIAFSLLLIAVRSGMISIGRNPLSKHSVMQALAEAIFASALVFAAGLLGIYLLLRI